MTAAIEMVNWLIANDFVPSTSTFHGFMERAWSHSSGHGFITLRLDFVNGRDSSRGYAVVIHATHGEPAICIGYTRALEDIQRLVLVLSALERPQNTEVPK